MSWLSLICLFFLKFSECLPFFLSLFVQGNNWSKEEAKDGKLYSGSVRREELLKVVEKDMLHQDNSSLLL